MVTESRRGGTVSVAFLAWIASFSWQSSLIATSPVLPLIKPELGLSSLEAGLVFSLPTLILTLLSAPMSRYTASFSKTNLIILGLSLIGIGGLLRGFAIDFASILVFASIFGVGWALVLPNVPAFINSQLDRKTAYSVTGIYTTGISIGSMAATILSIPLIYPIYGWRGVYLFWGIISVAISLAWLSRRENGARSIITTAVSGGGLSIRQILTVGLIMFSVNMVYYSLAGWLPTVYYSLGWPLATSSLLVTLLSVSAGASSIVYGSYITRLASDRKVMIWSSIVCVLSAVALNLNFSFSWIFLAPLSFALIGPGTITLAVLAATAKATKSSGIVVSIGFLGGVVGPPLFGALSDLTHGFTIPLLVPIIMSAFMLVMSTQIKGELG